MSFELRSLMADHYGPMTAQSYDGVVRELGWDYGATLKAVCVETLFGRRSLEQAASRGPRILELGTGTGNLMVEILEGLRSAVLRGASFPQGVDYLATDASAPMLEIAKKKIAAFPFAKSRFIASPMQELHLQDLGRFDAIVSTFAIHHLPLPEKIKLFERLYAVLAPGGALVIGDRMPPSPGTAEAEDYLRVVSTPLWKLFPEKAQAPSLDDLAKAMDRSFQDDGDVPSSIDEHRTALGAVGFSTIRTPFHSFGFTVVSAVREDLAQ